MFERTQIEGVPSSPIDKKPAVLGYTGEREGELEGEIATSQDLVEINNPYSKKPEDSVAKSKILEFLSCIRCHVPCVGNIFQCVNGHLMCSECHSFITCSKSRPKCSDCNTQLDSLQPTRNKFAEKMSALIRVSCPNPGCSKKICQGKLQDHLVNRCKYRVSRCKYHSLGCKWIGARKLRNSHKRHCDVRKLKGEDIIKLMQRNDDRALNLGEDRVFSLLSGSIRDVAIRNVFISPKSQNGSSVELRHADLVHALGHSWHFSHSNGNGNMIINCLLLSVCPKSFPVTMAVFPGPAFSRQFKPFSFDFEFSSRNPNSMDVNFSFPVPQGEGSDFGLSNGVLNVRIAFVDRRLGSSLKFRAQHSPEIYFHAF